MESTLDCLPCFASHALEVAKIATSDPARREEIMRRTFEFVAGMDLTATAPPAMARSIHAAVRAITGLDDPYLEIKDRSTAFALELLPRLLEAVDAHADRFEALVRLAIAGNIIDFGAQRDFDLEDAREVVLKAMDAPVDLDALRQLRHEMDKAERILYLLDNCGEAVFDKLLIELYRGKVVAVVRGGPILNDVTLREAAMSGITDLVEVVDTGDRAPGVLLDGSSPEFRERFARADLVVAKGQGNYETLSDTKRPIFFLLKVKCPVVARDTGMPLGSHLILPRNL